MEQNFLPKRILDLNEEAVKLQNKMIDSKNMPVNEILQIQKRHQDIMYAKAYLTDMNGHYVRETQKIISPENPGGIIKSLN